MEYVRQYDTVASRLYYDAPKEIDEALLLFLLLELIARTLVDQWYRGLPPSVKGKHDYSLPCTATKSVAWRLAYN
jgi:hypothetical protein